MQRINLYQIEENENVGLSFKKMMLTILGLISILLLWTVQIIYNFYAEYKEVSSLENNQKKISTALKKNKDILPDALKSQEQIVNEINLLSKVIKNKELLISGLVFSGNQTELMLSTYLKGLSNQRLEELWFTKLKIHPMGKKLYLEGNTSSSDAVALFIKKIILEKGFNNVVFSEFEISENEKNNLLQFKIESGAKKNEKN